MSDDRGAGAAGRAAPPARATSPLRALLTIAGKDLRQRLRDRSLIIYGLLVPFALAFIFSLLLGPLVSGDAPVTVSVGLVDEDASLMSAGMRTALAAVADAGLLSWRTVADEPAARELLAGGELDAFIIVPRGFGAAVTGGREGAVRVVGQAGRTFATQVAESVATSYVSRLRSASWAVTSLEDAGAGVVPALAFAQVAALPDALTLVPAQTSERQLDPVTYYAAGMAVFFVFFIVQLGVTGLLDEERDGTLARLLAAPIARRAILGGKVLSSAGIGVASMAVLALASTLVMGARWGNPVGVLLLIVAVVAAAAGILMLVAGLTRTAEAAGNLQSVVAITLGALGGAFFQVPDRGGLLAILQRASPHHWFMQGMGDLAAGLGVGALADELLAILAFAAVAGVIGWVALERRLNR